MTATATLFSRQFERIACADSVAWLRTIDDETVDLVITDPAYESLEKHRARGTTTRLKQSLASSNKWFPIFKNERFPELFREVYRVLKPNTHFYMQCDEETMWIARSLGEAVGFRYWKSLIWVKTDKSGKPRPGMGYHWRNTTERILFFEKGKRNLNKRGPGDTFHAPRVSGGYPTEKPEEIAAALILNSSAPGDLVIDPFMGSGSTGVAALQAGRRFAGCDIDAEAFELTRSRLARFGFAG